jgi:adsorption protein A
MMQNHDINSSRLLAGLLLAAAALPVAVAQELPSQKKQIQPRTAKASSARAQRVTRPRPAVPAIVNPAYAAADAAYKAYDRRDYPAAVAHGQEATRLAPTNRAYRLLLVNSLIAAQRLEEAEQALEQGMQVVGDDGTLAAQREILRRNQAQAAGAGMYRALQAGNIQAAAILARSAVRYAPEHAGYRLTLVSVLLQAEQFAEAEVVASEAIALLPDSATALVLRAYARQRLGRWTEARADQDRALQQVQVPAVQRQLRLIAADSALAAEEPQRTLDLLQGFPNDDAPVASRRATSQRLLRRAFRPAAVILTNANFPPPTVDCANVESAQTCTVTPGVPSRDPAFGIASAAYKALEDKDYVQASEKARQATGVSPTNREYQLLLMQALLGAGRLQEAEAAASTAVEMDPGDAELLAQRSTIRRQLGNTKGADEDAESALRTGALLPATTQSRLLADLGRMSEARARLTQAQGNGPMDGVSDLDQAYLASRVGDEEAAGASFARADSTGKLPANALQDAAYSALRRNSDKEAIGYFKRTVDAAEALQLKLEPQLLFNTRREIAEVSRRWGVLASLTYRNEGGVVPGFGVAQGSGSTKALQSGVEVYWRPFGYRNGRYVEVFARGFTTLDSQSGSATGSDSLQTALGLRWKPLSQQNAVLSLSRVFTHGGSDDWLAQAAYSVDYGTDLRVDVPSWWTTRLSTEVGRYLENPQTYGLANVQVGRSYRLGPPQARTVLFPHLVAGAEYNSTFTDKLSVGAGPGVNLRYWFREDRYAAPRSYVDFSVQYRAHVSGDKRASGLVLTTLLSY